MASHYIPFSFRETILHEIWEMRYYKKICGEPKHVTINCKYCFLLIFHPFECFSCPFFGMILYMWFFVMIFFCRTLSFCFFVFTLLLSTCTFSYPLTCIVERSDFLYITIFYRKYFEDSQDLLKLLLTSTQTTIDFSYQANEKTLQRVFPLLEALTQGYHIHNQSWSQRCQVNVVQVLWSITELLLFAIEITGKICPLLPGLCQRGKVKASGREVMFPL